MAPVDRVIVVVLDGVGIGELPDASAYGDSGSDSLGNTARALGGLSVPNLAGLGLGNIEGVGCVPSVAVPRAAFGRMAELSPGKDTTTGHWEIAGLVLDRAFPVYPHGFPPEIIAAFEEKAGTKVLGNRPASGTEIIKELGELHLRTGLPIVYTSADSVFQIAAHEEIIPVERLYQMCRLARQILVGEHMVGRVIARPFVGRPGGFVRTVRRRDFGVDPPGKTILDLVEEGGLEVVTLGKVDEIFNGRGVSRAHHGRNNEETLDFLEAVLAEGQAGLVFANLVDFDMLYGHRNDPSGYGAALERFDARLGRLLSLLREGDVLVLTSDHGCDPTTESTDHSREYVPLLVYGHQVRGGTSLGTRRTFADLGATAAELLGVDAPLCGSSFAREIFPVAGKDQGESGVVGILGTRDGRGGTRKGPGQG